MATRASDISRPFEAGIETMFNDLPVIASDIIYEGSAVGDNGSGLARPLVALDPLFGFCDRQCDNSLGAASAKKVRVREHGKVQLSVTGVASAADVGLLVYASDDDTFTLTLTGNTKIGKVSRWITGTTCIVEFYADQARPPSGATD